MHKNKENIKPKEIVIVTLNDEIGWIKFNIFSMVLKHVWNKHNSQNET